MDRPRQNDHLGVNKIGKNIRKSPLHQPSFSANANANSLAARPQAQPQVYNISKNDFRSIVQQLTGSPSRESLPRPPPQNNPPKPPNSRLHRIRPAPLTQLNRPSVPLPAMAPQQQHSHLARPLPPQTYIPQGTQQQQPMMGQGNQFWSNTAESPISEYMRYLQSSLGDSAPSGNQMQPSHEQRPYMPGHEHQPNMPSQPQAQAQHQPQIQPRMMPGPQPRINMQSPLQPYQYLPPPGLVPSPLPSNLPPPQFSGPFVTPSLPSPRFNQMYNGLPSPRYNGFGPLPSPTSQFVLPSPTGYHNMFSPRSPYPLLSPGVQYPPPLTPNFSFSQVAQQGSLGPGPGPGQGHPQPPPSPGLMFPLSPSGYFPMPSPRWGDY
ncbi:unnamed protein product [Cochlearia groenlandica]